MTARQRKEREQDLKKFAGMAMQGILANPDGLALSAEFGQECDLQPKEIVARVAVVHAEALVIEFERRRKPVPMSGGLDGRHAKVIDLPKEEPPGGRE